MGSRPGLPGTPAPWLPDEPIVSESIAAGADVVTFSGDKLLGGPQAGIIAGAEAPLALIRRHPLMRALRVDKMTYAALEATLLEYAAGRAGESIPVLKMMSLTADAIERRARALAEGVAGGSLEAQVVDGFSTVGGGSAPGSALPTKLVALSHATLGASALEGRLRSLDPPVIARIESERVVIDLRTVPDDDDGELARLLTSAPIRDPSR